MFLPAPRSLSLADPMLVYVIRHTPVDVPKGLCYGRSDVGLHADWRKHFAEVRKRLPLHALSGTNVYSSPLQRCVLLANELADSVQTSTLIQEMDFGDWELNPWDSVPKETIDRWLGDLANVPPPGGEALNDVYARAARFFTELAEAPHEVAFVLTHGGVIRCLVAHVLGLPLANAARLQVDYGGITRLRIERGLSQVESLNS